MLYLHNPPYWPVSPPDIPELILSWKNMPEPFKYLGERKSHQSLNDFISHKGLELYGWCIMTSHVQLIIGTKGNPLQNIMRDLKRHTSETLHKAIQVNNLESRKEWALWMCERAAKKIRMLQGFNCGNRKAIRYN